MIKSSLALTLAAAAGLAASTQPLTNDNLQPSIKYPKSTGRGNNRKLVGFAKKRRLRLIAKASRQQQRRMAKGK